VPEGSSELEIALSGTLAYGDYVNVFRDDLTLDCDSTAR